MNAPDLHLDVRSMPRPERHPRIFALFASLQEGQALVVVSDHEPRPLRAEFERTYAGEFSWLHRRMGDGRWAVRIARARSSGVLSAVEGALLHSPIFAGVENPALKDLAHFVRRAAIKRHHCIAEQGVLWPYVGIVESGIVQAQLLTADGREQAMYDVLPGELFAETALFDRGHIALRHVALTADTVVLLAPVERIRELARAEARVAARMEEAAAQHTRSILARFGAQISLSAAARVAAALLPYASPEAGLTGAAEPLPSMTQSEIAASAGTVKEVVNRALGELEALQAIARASGRIVKLDRDKLLAAIEIERLP